MFANHFPSLDAAIAFLFHVGGQWRGASEFQCHACSPFAWSAWSAVKTPPSGLLAPGFWIPDSPSSFNFQHSSFNPLKRPSTFDLHPPPRCVLCGKIIRAPFCVFRDHNSRQRK